MTGGDSLAELDREIAALVAGLAPLTALQRGQAEARLAELRWARYLVLSDDPQARPDRAAAALEELINSLKGYAARRDPGPVDGLWGLAFVERFLRRGNPADLDRAIECLGRAAVADHEYAEVRFELGRAYAARHDLTGDEADLDRAVAAVHDAVAWAGRRDGAWVIDAHRVLALAHGRRWQLRADRADADRADADRADADRADLVAALERFATVFADPSARSTLPPEVLTEYARLLGDRAVLDGRAADASAAVDLLAQARDRAGAETPVPVWFELVLARWTAYRRFGDASQLAPLAADLDELVRLVPDGSTEYQYAQTMRAAISTERVALGQESGSAADPATMAMLAGWLGSAMDEVNQSGLTGIPTDVPPRMRPLFDTTWLAERMAAARTALEQLPAGSEQRRIGACNLAVMWILWAVREPVGDWDEIVALLREAQQARTDDPKWQRAVHGMLGAVMTIRAMHVSPAGVGTAVDELTSALQHAGADDRLRLGLLGPIGMALGLRHGLQRADTDVEAALAILGPLRSDERLGSYQRLAARAMHGTYLASQGMRTNDRKVIEEAIAELTECLSELPADDVAYPFVQHNLGLAELNRLLLAVRQGGRVDHLASRTAAARVLESTRARGLSDAERAAMLGNAGAALTIDSVARQDVTTLGDAIAVLLEAVGLAPPQDENHVRYAVVLGGAYCCRYGVARRHDDLVEAVRWFEAAVGRLDDPGHFTWIAAHLGLGQAYRLRNKHADRARSRDLGLQAMRGHAWRVLVQSGTTHAVRAAADAVSDALEVAGWCVADYAVAQAVQALDACRGLALHAATVSADVGEQLAASGHGALAEQWRRQVAGGSTTPDLIPSDLRYRALRALVGEDRTERGNRARSGWLLDPPDCAEIAEVLRSAGIDALVYLVPRSEECAGCAVVVPARGEPTALPLLALYTQGGVLAAYVAAREAEAASSADHVRRRAGALLADLCGWAWKVALGPLLKHCRATGLPATPRLVLVPMGELGLVPWHAARDDLGRYALQDAIISYAASARLLCEVLRRPAVPPDADALVVGNPTGDLPHAGDEAAAIYGAFYSSGTYFGMVRAPEGEDGWWAAHDGAGTPAEVLDWMRRRTKYGASVLHLACHAEANPGARVILAGYDELTAESLAGQARFGPDATRPLGVVSLAACTTHVSGHGHDDAYTLATAFLVTGARSVFGSLWRIPDEATSLLMFMVHHYLREKRLPPPDALREAQLWMLDPHRKEPDTMPDGLASQIRSVRPDDLAGWAGFTHLGR